jgi:hypothetical protein
MVSTMMANVQIVPTIGIEGPRQLQVVQLRSRHA